VSFHILNQLLLFFTEKLVLQLHSVDLFLHGNNFSLSNRRVKSVLHLFLELVLALPEKDLLFSLDHIDDNVGLLFLQLSDLVFELDRLVLHLLELLLELHLNVEVVVGELLLLLVVLEDQVVEFVHLEDLVLLSDLELYNILAVHLDVTVDPDFLLIQN